jgi:hypothetical protein
MSFARNPLASGEKRTRSLDRENCMTSELSEHAMGAPALVTTVDTTQCPPGRTDNPNVVVSRAVAHEMLAKIWTEFRPRRTAATDDQQMQYAQEGAVAEILRIVNHSKAPVTSDTPSATTSIGIVTGITQGSYGREGGMVVSIRLTVPNLMSATSLPEVEQRVDDSLRRAKDRLEREAPLLNTTIVKSRIDGIQELRVVVPTHACASHVAWQYVRSGSCARWLTAICLLWAVAGVAVLFALAYNHGQDMKTEAAGAKVDL